MRTIGEDLRARGYYVVALRVPGHGTVPAGLTDVTWEDWLAAVRLGVRHVRTTIGDKQTAGARRLFERRGARLKYTVRHTLDGSGESCRLFLGLSCSRRCSASNRSPWLTRVNQHAWTNSSVREGTLARCLPLKYNPFKYTSFPANAGLQTWRLTTTLQRQNRARGWRRAGVSACRRC
jgi:hypothetical protein